MAETEAKTVADAKPQPPEKKKWRKGEEFWIQAEGMKEGEEASFANKKDAFALGRRIWHLGSLYSIVASGKRWVVSKRGLRKNRVKKA